MTLPGWVSVREPRGRLGGRYAKNVTICPTFACTTPASLKRKVYAPRRPQGCGARTLGWGRSSTSYIVTFTVNVFVLPTVSAVACRNYHSTKVKTQKKQKKTGDNAVELPRLGQTGPLPRRIRHPVYPQRFNWFESTPRNAPRLPIQTTIIQLVNHIRT